MLYWNKITGINRNMSYMENVENGVILPELNEEVLFCRPGYYDNTKDIYFSGYLFESDCDFGFTNSVTGGIGMVVDGIRWARFNKPETENNIGYAIAYLDEDGNGFKKDIPFIVSVEKDKIEYKVNELIEMKFDKVTVFKYIKPCTFDYDWDYINANKV